MHVSYQSNLYVMKGAFLLELVPFLLKDVERLGHCELLQEVSNKIINYNVSIKCLWNSVGDSSDSRAPSLSGGHLLEIRFSLESREVI